MPSLFLYGQTIHPIELDIHGPFRLIGFQLYPFVLKSFFNITAKDINDYCYDLTLLEGNGLLLKDLFKEKNTEQRIELLADYLLDIFRLKKDNLDFVIKQAIQLILENNGHSNVSDICGQLPLTQRTFERRFLKEVGVSPKQFSTIIQFQQSLEQLTMKEFSKLTDIVYSNGFSDQSHFIRVFKAFTGKTPKRFLNKAK